VVREALMEPLRVCQHAKQFMEVAGENGQKMLTPCLQYPNCMACPQDLSVHKAGKAQANAAAQAELGRPCRSCGAIRMDLYSVPSEQLLVPMVSMAMFDHILERARATVAEEELTRFIEWTEEFGQEG
jgi:hypothetical protein